ncbi:uncharacterized protein PV06_04672 [Exophiala oligosperma]|uniref:Uncharacterized protein n=1 Tax=Exophiala oligosperma TaxID=215243 RepID=A0A0D2DKU3_9EURO|nr:uncharacterized protein PV06_04672 [Exophiala oligosperma]KIW43583.1 hypothetical protein PV06_04672 [Exophiala oligosperma]
MAAPCSDSKCSCSVTFFEPTILLEQHRLQEFLHAIEYNSQSSIQDVRVVAVHGTIRFSRLYFLQPHRNADHAPSNILESGDSLVQVGHGAAGHPHVQWWRIWKHVCGRATSDDQGHGHLSQCQHVHVLLELDLEMSHIRHDVSQPVGSNATRQVPDPLLYKPMIICCSC